MAGDKPRAGKPKRRVEVARRKPTRATRVTRSGAATATGEPVRPRSAVAPSIERGPAANKTAIERRSTRTVPLSTPAKKQASSSKPATSGKPAPSAKSARLSQPASKPTKPAIKKSRAAAVTSARTTNNAPVSGRRPPPPNKVRAVEAEGAMPSPSRPRRSRARRQPVHQARFGIGEVVRHKFYPFRGVVFDIDPVFANTEEWWHAIPPELRPRKDQPFYHLLAENDETEYIAYVSEQNLLLDETGTPLRHPRVSEMFVEDDEGRLRPVFRQEH